MNHALQGQTALVSGSTAGIGLAIAQALGRDGASVVVNGRTTARVDAALHTLREENPDGHFVGIAADLASAEGAATVIAAHPDIDILINNLGIFAVSPFESTSDAEWTRFFETNVMSGVRLARHYVPRLIAKGSGRVVFISSESGVQIPTEMIHYGTTKAAQIAIARGLAQQAAKTGVTVNSVLAGPTRSEGVGTFIAEFAHAQGVSQSQFEADFFRTARPSSLLQRFLDPAEIANVVVFLASPAASAITGASIRAEGGLLQSAW
ncbi:MAG: SDR family oxidoreductase [Tahibacter sp.]